MKKTFLLLIIFSITYTLKGQNLKSIVKDIAKINEVQFDDQSGKYQNFINFEKLKKKASVVQLLDLINNENDVVACYSSFALIDLNYNHIDEIFANLLEKNNKVKTLDGCLYDEEEVPYLFYNYFNFNSNSEENIKAKIISKLDSISLYNGKSKFLTNKVLEKRISDKFNEQIKYLAYQKKNLAALFYISNWKIEYDESTIKKAWLNYINNTEISNEYLDFNYATVDKILNLNDIDLTNSILNKMKLNKEKWQYEKDNYNNVFNKYNLKIE